MFKLRIVFIVIVVIVIISCGENENQTKDELLSDDQNHIQDIGADDDTKSTDSDTDQKADSDTDARTDSDKDDDTIIDSDADVDFSFDTDASDVDADMDTDCDADEDTDSDDDTDADSDVDDIGGDVTTRTFNCSQLPANAKWNTVSGYEQVLSGLKWIPPDSVTTYNEIPSSTACHFICDSETGFSWDGSNCIKCGDGVKNGYEECDDGNSDNNDYCKNDCTENFCGDGYILTGSEFCDGDTILCSVLGIGTDGTAICEHCSGWKTAGICSRINTCAEKPATGTIWNTVSNYKQTWNGSGWEPIDDSLTEYNEIPSDSACRFKCDYGYEWDDSSLSCMEENLCLSDSDCDNGNVCDGIESCESGACISGEPLSCDISESCRYGICDEETGCVIEELPNGASCADSNPCNGEEQCWFGECEAGETVVCDQPDFQCMVAECVDDIGCLESQAENGTSCDDGNDDTVGDYCEEGTCISGKTENLPVSFVPATGLALCYNDSSESVCNEGGSLFAGQDAEIDSPEMNYSELETTKASGSEAPVLKDEVTGLFWEQSASLSTYTFQEASDYCDDLVLGNRDDWRLPNRRELLSIVDYSYAAGQIATINPLFTNTVKGWYWTSDVPGTNPDRYWRVSFKWGTSDHQDYSVADGYVRCVAGTSSYSDEALYAVETEDGVYDSSTGLMWQRVPSGYQTWQASLDYCNNLDQMGFAGWRLPNVKELSTLLRGGYSSPVLDSETFPGIRAGQVFWTSTTYNDPTMRNNAYIVGLGDIGAVGKAPKTNNYRTMCVRSCPCPDPRCCFRCEPLEYAGCDDGDASTVNDSCRDGYCTGDPAGTPEPDPQPPFDCTTLDCGSYGICVRDDYGIESCLCKEGLIFEDGQCVPESVPVLPDLKCVPFDIGKKTVCLSASSLSKFSGDLLKKKQERIVIKTAVPASYFLPIPYQRFESSQEIFKVHDQQSTPSCSYQATNAAMELMLGSSYKPLSEAHLFQLADRANKNSVCKDGIYLGNLLERIKNSDKFIVRESDGEIKYNDTEERCNPDSGELVTWPKSTDIGIIKLKDFSNLTELSDDSISNFLITSHLAANHPVILSVPVFDYWDNNAQRRIWGEWINNWSVITNHYYEWFRTRQQSKICHDPSNKKCNNGDDGECVDGACARGWHAIVLIGYNKNDTAGEVYYFLNSWGEDWGKRFPEDKKTYPYYSGGIGKISFDFVRDHATGAFAISESIKKCSSECVVGTKKCAFNPLEPFNPNPTLIQECKVDSDGCHKYVTLPDACAKSQRCEQTPPAQPVCKGWCGNSYCDNGENCLTCPSDCGCTDGKTCNSSGQCMASCGADACQPSETGCVDSNNRWWCGLLPGDSCLDQISVACDSHQKCEGGACITDCNTPRQYQKGCKSGTKEVWWFNWCDQTTDYIETCEASETCVNGICKVSCTGSGPLICYDSDEYYSDLCGNPTTQKKDCGTSGYLGSPVCSSDGLAVTKQYCNKGCSGNACFSNCSLQRTECPTGVPCLNGVCTSAAAQCGDGLCTSGVEDCATCLQDCKCWDGEKSVCNPTGQCVQCLTNTDCPQGSTCNTSTNTCTSGCNECSPLNSHQCLSASSRQTCQLVGNCYQWVSDNCESGYACCNGSCVSTTSPDAPTLVSPAANVAVSAGTVRFEWENSANMNRATLKVCKTASLSGNCPISEEEKAGYYYRDKTLSAGTYYWSVRGISSCDASGWGDFATPRKIVVSEPVTVTPETCNGVDDDGDGVIDNKGTDGLGCMREIFQFVRYNDTNNSRLQIGETPGTAPQAPTNYEDPDWMESEGRHPNFLLYKESYGLSNLKKFYYCAKGSKVGDYDNLYTTNLSDCSSYDTKDQSYFIGYIFTSDPGATDSYANWLYSPYYNNAVKTKQLWRIRKISTGQNMFTAYDPGITSMIPNGWCCVNGPSDRCSGNWCSGGSTTPVGWVLIPK